MGTKIGIVEGTVTDETKPVAGGAMLVTPDRFSPGRRFMTRRGAPDQVAVTEGATAHADLKPLKDEDTAPQ